MIYLIFIAYIFSAVFHSSDNAIYNYLSNIVVLALLCGYMLLMPNRIQSNVSLFFLLVLFSVLSVLSLYDFDNVYIYLLVVKCFVLFVFFKNANLDVKDVLTAINITYLTYVSISVAFWLFVVFLGGNEAPLAYDKTYYNFFGYSYKILIGIEGSPANIDSYSGLVFLLNALYFKGQRHSKKVVLLSILCLFLSFRLTPILAMVISFATFKLSKRRSWFVFFNLVVLFMFFIVFGFSRDLVLNVLGFDFQKLIYYATSARSVIWWQQMEVFLNHFSILNFVFGSFDIETFRVPYLSVYGIETGLYNSNPHNTYLIFLFRSPLIMIICLSWLYLCSAKTMPVRCFPILTYIYLCAYMNNSIIGLENPVFIISILCFWLDGRQISDLNRNELRRFE